MFCSKPVFFSYLSFQSRKLKSPHSVTPESGRHFYDLVRRAVSSMSTKYEVPNCKDVYWYNYHHVNAIILQYLSCLPPTQITSSYDKFVSLFPDNVDLILQ